MRRNVFSAFNLSMTILRHPSSHLQVLLAILTVVLTFSVAIAGQLSVSPVSFDLERFPAWKSQSKIFTIRNTGKSKVNLLRVRSSCSCLAADFQPCALEAGQEPSLTVTIPANSVSGDFSKAVFLETDAPRRQPARVLQLPLFTIDFTPSSRIFCVFRQLFSRRNR